MRGEAAALFRLYLSISKDPEGIVGASQRLKALEAASPPVAGAATLPVAATETGRSETVEASAVQASGAPSWPRLAATGGAVAGVAAGVALMLAARADSVAAAALPVRNDAEITTYNAKFDSAERLWTAGVAVTAVGAGLAVWATWMHLQPGPKRSAWQLDAGPSVARLTVHF